MGPIPIRGQIVNKSAEGMSTLTIVAYLPSRVKIIPPARFINWSAALLDTVELMSLAKGDEYGKQNRLAICWNGHASSKSGRSEDRYKLVSSGRLTSLK